MVSKTIAAPSSYLPPLIIVSAQKGTLPTVLESLGELQELSIRQRDVLTMILPTLLPVVVLSVTVSTLPESLTRGFGPLNFG
jgi:hypothetical protein